MTRIENKIIFNYLLESKRKNINQTERSIIIKKYMDDNKLSFRELSKNIGIPHSTLNLWVNGEPKPESNSEVFVDSKIKSLTSLLKKDIVKTSNTNELLKELSKEIDKLISPHK